MLAENPYALLAIPVALAAAVATWRLGKKKIAQKMYRCEHPLAEVVKAPRASEEHHLPVVLLLAALTLILVSLASPYVVVEQKVRGIEEVKASLEVKVKPPVILILDVSGSMSGAKLEQAKRALLRFLREVEGKCSVGLIAFSDHVVASVPPTSNASAVAAMIRALEAQGGTMYSYPFMLAGSWLEPYRAFNVSAAVVFASDGLPGDRVKYRRFVERLAKEGVPVYAVFIGSGGSEDLEGIEEIKWIARETRGAWFYVSDVEKLVKVYERLAENVSSKLAEVTVKAEVERTVEKKEYLDWMLLLAALALLLASMAARWRAWRITF